MNKPQISPTLAELRLPDLNDHLVVQKSCDPTLFHDLALPRVVGTQPSSHIRKGSEATICGTFTAPNDAINSFVPHSALHLALASVLYHYPSSLPVVVVVVLWVFGSAALPCNLANAYTIDIWNLNNHLAALFADRLRPVASVVAPRIRERIN